MTSRTIGQQAEQAALEYLLKQGLKLIDRNFHCRNGEIDLIMGDGKQLVFVEVKYRRNDYFGHAAETVTPAKQRKIITTALYYLQRKDFQPANGYQSNQDCRFDVIAMSPASGRAGALEIDWIKNAFELSI